MVPATLTLRIVGLLKVRRREAPAMAGADRMTIEEVVRQVMVREHGDVVRAALEAVCRELMEGEVSELVGAELGERRPDDRDDASQRLPRARVADPGGDGRAADPQAAARIVLSELSRAAPAL